MKPGAGRGSGDADRARAIAELPTEYAVAIRLADAGVADDIIAAGTGVERASVPTLLRIARLKLAEAMQGESADHS